MISRIRKQARIARTFAILALGSASVVASCGPPLTDPASTNLSGTWFSAGPAAGLTNLTVVLDQSANGTITGTYAGTGTRGLQFCPAPTGPCPVSGTISGANTVFQVFFELKDAGQFSGQLIDATDLKGAMSRVNTTQAIQFEKR
jgi:hypothetical protein